MYSYYYAVFVRLAFGVHFLDERRDGDAASNQPSQLCITASPGPNKKPHFVRLSFCRTGGGGFSLNESMSYSLGMFVVFFFLSQYLWVFLLLFGFCEVGGGRAFFAWEAGGRRSKQASKQARNDRHPCPKPKTSFC